MRVTICGSIDFIPRMRGLKKELIKLGVESVYLPRGFKKLIRSKTPEESAQRKIKYDLINMHYKKILRSDCILVANYDKEEPNYIGGNAFLEIGFAFVNKRPIYLLNPVPEAKYKSEILGMKPVVLNGDLVKMFASK